jgi:hypothetical protein
MPRFLRILCAIGLAAALFAATGFTLARHSKTAPFLRAKDRLERGDDRSEALAALAAEGPREVGPYRLTIDPRGGPRLFERCRDGWREVR